MATKPSPGCPRGTGGRVPTTQDETWTLTGQELAEGRDLTLAVAVPGRGMAEAKTSG